MGGREPVSVIFQDGHQINTNRNVLSQ